MKQVPQPQFVASIKNGDIGLIHGHNFFGWLQALYAHRFKEGPYLATHGFYVKVPPEISEANGLIISGDATFLKFIGDSTEAWFFRYWNLTPAQLEIMNTYAIATEVAGGHYSINGIFQFAKSFLQGKRNENDESGEFCTKHTGDIILSPPLPYTSLPVWQVDPTTQLNWFLGDEAQGMSWFLAGHYDGNGLYFLDDSLV